MGKRRSFKCVSLKALSISTLKSACVSNLHCCKHPSLYVHEYERVCVCMLDPYIGLMTVGQISHFVHWLWLRNVGKGAQRFH